MTLPSEPKAKASLLPDTSKGFWRYLLLASLLINLAVAGALIGGRWHHRDGPGQPGFQQFVPGRFFMGLGADRRRELGGMLRGARPEFDSLRQKSSALAEQVAVELEKPDFDSAKVAALIDGFTTGPDSMAAKGGAVLKDFYAKLKPEERLALAKSIRERIARKER